MRRLALILSIASVLLGATGSASAGAAPEHRFAGYVAGVATGAGHDFVVGDGLYLVFVDAKEPSTSYRVCWHRLRHPRHRCWSGESGPAGTKDRIFTAAPGAAGTYLVEWTVGNRREAAWRFAVGAGD